MKSPRNHMAEMTIASIIVTAIYLFTVTPCFAGGGGDFNGLKLDVSSKVFIADLKAKGLTKINSSIEATGTGECARVPFPMGDPVEGTFSYLCTPEATRDPAVNVIDARIFQDKVAILTNLFRDEMAATVIESISEKFKSQGEPTTFQLDNKMIGLQWGPYAQQLCQAHECFIKRWKKNFKAYLVFYYQAPATKDLPTAILVSIESIKGAESIGAARDAHIKNKKAKVKF